MSVLVPVMADSVAEMCRLLPCPTGPMQEILDDDDHEVDIHTFELMPAVGLKSLLNRFIPTTVTTVPPDVGPLVPALSDRPMLIVGES